MKKTALLIIAVVGVGSVLVPGGAGAAVSNIVGEITGPVNDTGSDAWVISDNTKDMDFVIKDSTISALPGSNVVISVLPTSSTPPPLALGRSGFQSSYLKSHNVTVIDSLITGSDGGTYKPFSPELGTVVAKVAFVADGGDGMSLAAVNGAFTNATITGGNGGEILIAGASSKDAKADGGFGLKLQEASTLYATNSTITGGNGGVIRSGKESGSAVGGAGIVIDGKTGKDVILDLIDTQVFGGIGGTVANTNKDYGKAYGGSALLVGGGGNLTITNGTFIGGQAGTVLGKKVNDGKSIDVTGANLTLVGGSYDSGIRFSAGDSTLALGSAVQSIPLLEVAGNSLKVTQWSDGQLTNVNVSAGTITLDGSAPFNLGAGSKFQLGGSGAKPALAHFSSGLVVAGTLGLGYGTNTADAVHATAGSKIISLWNGEKLGSLESTNLLTIDAGTKWEINDQGKNRVNVGQVFTIATTLNTNDVIALNLDKADVSYVGANGQAGWLGKIIDVTNTLTKVQVTYGLGDIDEMLGVKGDLSSPFGQAISDLTALVISNPSTSSNILVNLGAASATVSAASRLATNGLLHTAQSAKSVVGNQQLYAGVINNRTHSYLNHEGVGYSVGGPTGAAGWDFLRNFSDRVESKISTDGLRSLSDRVEGQYRYDDVASSMRNAEKGTSLAGVRLPESWQIWGEGFGSSAHQDAINGVAGYDVGTGGAMLGIDKRFNNLMIGMAGGFSQSSVDGYQGNDARIDTLNLIGYLSAYSENAYMDLNVNYAINNVDSEFKSYGYEGNYDANALGFYVGGGYGIALNDWLVLTPEASFMGTYYARDSYEETSSLGLPTKEYESYDQFSSVGSVGATLTMVRKIDLSSYEMLVQPQVRAHLVHDFNADMDPETYRLQGGNFDIETPVAATEDNLFKIGAGIRLTDWNDSSTEVGLDVDGLFADGYNAYMISGKIIHRF
ncbi:MAG: autotransporter outer membrane beta-barrel domain-containing protein [Pontiellaceae bacterium]|nr:autotransporter outer membrane beta-barrel domain-containing protein [Pontiellaceae bacterium]